MTQTICIHTPVGHQVPGSVAQAGLAGFCDTSLFLPGWLTHQEHQYAEYEPGKAHRDEGKLPRPQLAEQRQIDGAGGFRPDNNAGAGQCSKAATQ